MRQQVPGVSSERGAAVDRRKTAPVRLRGAGVLAALLFASPLLAQAKCQVQSIEMPVKMVGARAVATVQINGAAVPFTVDSGAYFSMLTEAAAAQLSLRLNRNATVNMVGIDGGVVKARTTTVDTLGFLKGEINKVDFIVGGNDPGSGTMGLLGRNILSMADTEFDLAHGVIRFLTPNDDCAKVGMAYWAGSTPVTELELVQDYHSRLPSIRAKVKFNGTELTALFDSGASTSVVSARATRRAGVPEADWKPAGVATGVGHYTVKSWIVPFERFEVGGEAISNGRLMAGDIDLGEADMLLGMDFFLSHRIYVSKQQSRMYLTYVGGPAFSLDRVAVVNGAPPPAAPATADAAAMTADELARRGAASASRGDFQSALADLDRACELEPTSAAYLAQRGGIQVSLKHPVKAMEDFDRALQIDSTLGEARFQRAALRVRTKDLDGAKSDLDELDRALPLQAQMRLAMASLYMAAEQPAQTVAQLDQWLKAHPGEIKREGALNSRCWARMMLGTNLDRAKDDCDDAVDADPKNAAFLDSRGWVFLRQGKFDRALADFDRSLAIQPKLASALYGRGVARNRLGDAARGDEDLAAARKLQPEIERRLAPTGLVAQATPKP